MEYEPNDKYGLFYWIAVHAWARARDFESDEDFELMGMFSEFCKHPEVMRNTEELQAHFGISKVAFAYASVAKESSPAQRILVRYGLKPGHDSLLEYVEQSFLARIDLAASKDSTPLFNRIRIRHIAEALDHNVKPMEPRHADAPAYSRVTLLTEDLTWLREALFKIGSDWSIKSIDDANRAFGLVRGSGKHEENSTHILKDLVIAERVALLVEQEGLSLDRAAGEYETQSTGTSLFAGKSNAEDAYRTWIVDRPASPRLKRGRPRTTPKR